MAGKRFRSVIMLFVTGGAALTSAVAWADYPGGRKVAAEGEVTLNVVVGDRSEWQVRWVDNHLSEKATTAVGSLELTNLPAWGGNSTTVCVRSEDPYKGGNRGSMILRNEKNDTLELKAIGPDGGELETLTHPQGSANDYSAGCVRLGGAGKTDFGIRYELPAWEKARGGVWTGTYTVTLETL